MRRVMAVYVFVSSRRKMDGGEVLVGNDGWEVLVGNDGGGVLVEKRRRGGPGRETTEGKPW